MRFLKNFSASSVNLTEFVILVVITFAASAVLLALILSDNRPPPWDYATYLSRSLVFYYALRSGSPLQFARAYLDHYRTPLVSLAALPVYAIFGTSYASVMLVNLAFLVVLVASTYKLGELVGSSTLGLVSAVVVAALPGIITFGRVFGQDFPLTVMVTASMCLAFGCKGFNKRGISVALGVVLGLGMLTKWTFIIFVAPPVAFQIFTYRRRVNLRNAFATFTLFLAISSTWYFSALQHNLVSNLARVAWGTGAYNYASANSLLDPRSLIFYPSAIFDLVGPSFCLSLIGAAILSSALLLKGIRKKRVTRCIAVNISATGSLLSALLVSLLVFTLLVNKSVRFILPVVPVFVLLLVLATWRMGGRIGPLILIIIAISGSCISLAGALYPQLGVSVGIYHPTNIADEKYSYEYSLPDPRDWRVDQSLEFVAAENPNASVAILANHWVFNQDTLKYYALRLGLIGLSFTDYRDDLIGRVGGYEGLSAFDIVFMKTGSIGDPAITQGVRGILARLSNPNDPFYLAWKTVKTFDLPDGSQLMIFLKNSPNPSSGSASMMLPAQAYYRRSCVYLS